MLEPQPAGQRQLGRDIVIDLAEARDDARALAIGCKRDETERLNEIAVELVAQLFVRDISADDPARGAGLARGQPYFLRGYVRAASEIGAGIGQRRGVPVIIFAPVEMLVGGDAGKLCSPEIDRER